MKTSSRLLKLRTVCALFSIFTLALSAQEAGAPGGEKSTLRAIGAPSESVVQVVSAPSDADDFVRFAKDVHISAGEKIVDNVIAILGDVLVDGEALHNVTAVKGDITINGTVHGDVTAIMGDIKLGSQAIVEGKVNLLDGELQRDPGSSVLGKITHQYLGSRIHAPDSLESWWTHALSHGALLGVGRGLGWLAKLSFAVLGFSVLLALGFPKGLRRTGEVLAERPAVVVLSALLTLLALPLVFLLLCVTIVGIPVALFGLPVTILFVVFGQVSIHGLVGRRVLRERGSLVAAVLVGSLIFGLLYYLPGIGLLAAMVMGVLGLGCSVAALLTIKKKTETPALYVAPVAPPFVSTKIGVDTLKPADSSPSPEASFMPPVMPVSPVSALPRAGFWIRTAAMFIDLILVSMICGPTGAGPLILPVLATYGAVMWKLKGSTIGGIVCGLRVVRLDDRALDWPTVIARALGCFLSLVVFALGFLRVAFAADRQSWHDKIAGTVVVREPKGVSLV